jgi:hypothetical protein
MANLLALMACNFCVPRLRFPCVVHEGNTLKITNRTSTGVIPLPFGEVVVGICHGLGSFTMACQGCILEPYDQATVAIRVSSQY